MTSCFFQKKQCARHHQTQIMQCWSRDPPWSWRERTHGQFFGIKATKPWPKNQIWLLDPLNRAVFWFFPSLSMFGCSFWIHIPPHLPTKNGASKSSTVTRSKVSLEGPDFKEASIVLGTAIGWRSLKAGKMWFQTTFIFHRLRNVSCIGSVASGHKELWFAALSSFILQNHANLWLRQAYQLCNAPF